MPEKSDLRSDLKQYSKTLEDKIRKITAERDKVPPSSPDRARLERLLAEFTSAKDIAENCLIEISVEEMQAAASEIENIYKNINKEIKALEKVSDNVKTAANIVKSVANAIVALAAIAAL